MLDVHLTVATNYVSVLPPMMTVHKNATVPPTTPFCPAVETPTTAMWPPGFALQQNKLTTNVTHKFLFIMLEGHDCGYQIPHITIPPNNTLLPIIILFSSRKLMFSASTVKANGTAIGCSQLFPLPMPMMACAEPITLPTVYPIATFMNNVTAGMTFGDLLAGLIAIAIQIALDAFLELASSRGPFEKLTEAFASFLPGGELVRGALGKLLGFSSVNQLLVKTLANVLTGTAKLILTGEGTIKVAVGSAFFGGNVSLTKNANGTQIAIQIVTPGTTRTASRTFGKDGSTTDKASKVDTDRTTRSSEETKATRDADGNLTEVTETSSKSSVGTDNKAAGSTKTRTTKPGQPTQTSGGDFGKPGRPPIIFSPFGDPLL